MLSSPDTHALYFTGMFDRHADIMALSTRLRMTVIPYHNSNASPKKTLVDSVIPDIQTKVSSRASFSQLIILMFLKIDLRERMSRGEGRGS